MPYDYVVAEPDIPLISIDEKALSMLLEVRDREVDAPYLGLVIGISGIEGDRFTYEMALMRLEDAAAGDHVVTDGILPIIVPAGDVESLRGARIQMSRDLLKPGLTIENPNSPSPLVNATGLVPDLTGTAAERVVAVVDQAINPAIASHGGFVEVVAVEDQTAYVRLGGGCQGCGMASVTLSQGIESTITQMVPEVAKVVDVTDHAQGENPYYEQAKK